MDEDLSIQDLYGMDQEEQQRKREEEASHWQRLPPRPIPPPPEPQQPTRLPYFPVPQQEQPQPPPQPLPVPFSQSDKMNLNRLQNGLSDVAQRISNGELTDEHGQELIDQINKRLQPLLQHQKEAQQQQEQEADHQLKHLTAKQQVMQAQNSQFAADNFERTMKTITDPETGDRATFYQKEPGKWEEATYDSAHRNKDRKVEAISGAGEEGASPELQGLLGLGASLALGGTPGKPIALPDRNDPHTMQIWNGNKLTEATYTPKPGGGYGYSVKHFDENGEPISNEQAGLTPGTLTAADLKRIRAKAQVLAGAPPTPTGNLAHDFKNKTEYAHRVNIGAAQLASQEGTLKHELFKTDELAKRKTAAEEIKAQKEHADKTYTAQESSVRKEWDKYEHNKALAATPAKDGEHPHPEPAAPPWAKDFMGIDSKGKPVLSDGTDIEDVIHKAAMKRTRHQWQVAHPDKPFPGDPPLPGASGSTGQPQAPAAQEQKAPPLQERMAQADPKATEGLQSLTQAIGKTDKGLNIGAASTQQLTQLEYLVTNHQAVGMSPEAAYRLRKAVQAELQQRMRKPLPTPPAPMSAPGTLQHYQNNPEVPGPAWFGVG